MNRKKAQLLNFRWTYFLRHKLVGIGWFMLLGALAAAELGYFTTSRFSGAGNCAFCHDPWSPRNQNSGAVLTSDWRSTMMAHSFKDPLWRAVMEAEVAENPELRSFIENKCQTCHAPLARTQAGADGTNELAFRAALNSPLAAEGVGCTLCHQIQPAGLGEHASFTGHYQVGTNREIFGPYEDVVTMPMQRHVDYTPVHGAHVQDSAFCATCHTLFTPILSQKGESTGEFPEQVPYLEWRNSAFAREGRHCQDCHMPRSDAPVKVSTRPPWIEPHAPFWEHEFVGGNSFMLGLLANNPRALQPNADPSQLRSTLEKTRAQLQRAAKLHLAGDRKGQNLEIRSRISPGTSSPPAILTAAPGCTLSGKTHAAAPSSNPASSTRPVPSWACKTAMLLTATSSHSRRRYRYTNRLWRTKRVRAHGHRFGEPLT
jgi:hypothetical protein